MEVQVISSTVQKFNGESYYYCGSYFQRKGKRLHRMVWEYHNGTIPKGYHIHHKDENKSNNDISNLEMVWGGEHMSHHMNNEERKAQSRELVKNAIAKAPAWHHSKEGKQWHSEHSKKAYQDRGYRTSICSFCGKEYQTKHIYSEGSNHFCHNNCKAAYHRRRVRNGEIVK